MATPTPTYTQPSQNPNLSPLYPYGYDPNNLPANASTPASTAANKVNPPKPPTPGTPPGANYSVSPVTANSGSADWEQAVDMLRPEAPQIDPRYQALQDQQIALYKNFIKNAPSYAASIFNPQAENARLQNASNVKGIREGANSIGNLYSGYEQGAEGSAANNLTGNLANLRAQTNQQVTQTGQGLLNQAIGSGFGMAGLGTNQASFDASQTGNANLAAQQQAALSNQQIGQFGQGIGSVLGAAFAPKKVAPSTTYNFYSPSSPIELGGTD